MTQRGKMLALISLLCAGISGAASAQVVNQQVPATCSMESEKAKWVALRMVLSEKITHSKSFMNKIGAAMNHYAPLWAGIVGVAGMLGMKWHQSRLVCRSYYRSLGDSGFSAAPMSFVRNVNDSYLPEGSSSAREGVCSLDGDEDDAALGDSSVSATGEAFCRPFSPRPICTKNKCTYCCCGMSFLLPATLVYVLCKTCGAYLEAPSSCCFAVVTEIAGKWDDFKTYMPTALHPFFLGYAQDLKTHGKLTTIDKNGARQLIESILAMSVVIEAAK